MKTLSQQTICFILLLGFLWISETSSRSETAPEPTVPEGMVLIPEGVFEMGSRRSLRELEPTALFQNDRHMLGPEDPAHEVNLDAYFIDRNEVTNKSYREFVQATGSRPSRYDRDPNFNGDTQPVVGVSWKEAQAFCKWKQGRLPTEAEWEKAGRGKRPVKFPWGNELPDSTRANFNKGVGHTQPVGSYEAGISDYGVHDLSGNVAEWVSDWHFPEYYLFSPKDNPAGPPKGQYKIIRGGNWMNNAEDIRLTYRNATVPKTRNKLVGFRCVREVS